MKSNGHRTGVAKIIPLENLARVLKALRAKNRRIVHCHGVFDLLHPGHIRHLEAAKRHGDILVVTVTRDEFVNKGPGRPVFNQRLRAESVAALGCVDFVAINETPTAVEAIRKLQPHLYVKGQDYEEKKGDLTGAIYREEKTAREVGARLVYTHEPAMSSTHLLNAHFGVYPPETHAFLKAFSRRYSSEDIIRRAQGLRPLKVLVLGETILDEYHYCQAMGKSPKETIVSTRYLREEAFAGGVLAAANHAAGFVSEVHLATCLGNKDSREDFIRSHLRPNVKPRFFYQEGVPTIIKRRFVDPSFLTKMFEVSYLEDRDLPPALENKLSRYLTAALPQFDLVLLTDYGHGMIGPRLVRLLCKKSRFLAVNTQTNSANMGYNLITKYPRADYVCIDEPELRLAERNRYGDLKEMVLDVTRKLKAESMVVTRGHHGALAYSKREGFTTIPVLSQKVVDRTGAGDAYLSVSALCVAGGLPMDLSGFLGNAAGALHVGTVCNRTSVEPAALFKFVAAMLK